MAFFSLTIGLKLPNDVVTLIYLFSRSRVSNTLKNQIKYRVDAWNYIKVLNRLSDKHHFNNQEILWNNYEHNWELDILPSFAQFIYENMKEETIQKIYDSLIKCQCCQRHYGKHSHESVVMHGEPLIPGYGWAVCPHGTDGDNKKLRCTTCQCPCRHYRRQLHDVLDTFKYY